jgi:hypothetical protein
MLILGGRVRNLSTGQQRLELMIIRMMIRGEYKIRDYGRLELD